MIAAGGEEDCPFCEIAERDDPDAREVYRDEHTVAFFPTEPAVLGHHGRPPLPCPRHLEPH
jgi:histidine triad (HIT) family protein